MWHIFDKGGPVMYPLLACSIIAVSVVIERTIFWFRLGLRSQPSLVDEVLELSRQGD
jgi:biopolymer transport protein ExbB